MFGRWLDRFQKLGYNSSMKIKNHLLDDPKVRIGSSPNQGGTIVPRLLVLHYTASGGEDGKGDADYLSRASSRASAHIVVGRNGSIDQIVPLNKKAWHAGVSTWEGDDNVNDYSIGIEIDNWGWLKDGKSHAGVVVKDVFKGTRSGHNEWEAYPKAQLDSVEKVIAAICEAYNITDIVGHEDIAPGRKQDPGPALDAFKADMQKKYTKEGPPKEPKTTANLRLRAQPSVSSVVLTTIPEGSTVRIVDKNDIAGWLRVQFGSRIGFVAKQYLTV